MKHILIGTIVTGIAALGLAQSAGKVSMHDISWSSQYNAIVEVTNADGQRHSGGAHVLMGDGSVRFVSESTDSLQGEGKRVTIKFVQTGSDSATAGGFSMANLMRGKQSWKSLKITLLDVQRDGKLKAKRVIEFSDAQSTSAKGTDRSRAGTVLLDQFAKSHSTGATHYVGSANGGVWKTTNG